jgi:hypothetical protein
MPGPRSGAGEGGMEAGLIPEGCADGPSVLSSSREGQQGRFDAERSSGHVVPDRLPEIRREHGHQHCLVHPHAVGVEQAEQLRGA